MHVKWDVRYRIRWHGQVQGCQGVCGVGTVRVLCVCGIHSTLDHASRCTPVSDVPLYLPPSSPMVVSLWAWCKGYRVSRCINHMWPLHFACGSEVVLAMGDSSP